MSEYIQKQIEQRAAQRAALAERRAALAAELAAVDQDDRILAAEQRAYEDALAHVGPKPLSPATRPEQAGHWPAALDALREAGKGEFTTDDAIEALKRVGHVIKRKSVRSRMTELVRDGQVVRVAEGLYRFPGSDIPGKVDGEAVGSPPQ
jgi:hypothetical protein